MSDSSSSSDEGERAHNEAAGDRLAIYSNIADRLIEIAEHGGDLTTSSPPPDDPGGGASVLSKNVKEKDRSIEEKLLELHVEESLKERSHWSSHLNPCSNLLSILCKRERFNRLQVTLHPNDEGYTIAFASKDSHVVDLAKLSYEEDDLLTSIDNQELPTSLIDLLDFQNSANNTNTDNLYYNGCIIAEIKDERCIDPHRTIKSVNKSVHPSQGNVSHVLLRPTTQSIICDSNLIVRQASNGQKWTSEDRSILEGQLAIATQPPLCLDPNPVVSVLARKAVINRQKFATVPMRRAAKKFSQVGINRKRKLESQAQSNPPNELKLHDFITSVREKQISENKLTSQEALLRHQNRIRANLKAANALAVAASGASQGQINYQESSNNTDMVTGLNGNSTISNPSIQILQSAPLATDVSKHARAIPKRVEVNDNTPHIVEEYILETAERGTQRIYHTRLTIFQRLSNDEYLGELYVERDYRENDKKGSTCRFVLGTRPHALRYINQFTEIFTEEGRKSVKITHQVPNQPPRITLTPGMKERMNERLNDRQAALSAAQAASQGAISGTPSATDSVNKPVSQAATSAGGEQTANVPIIENGNQAMLPSATAGATVNAARRIVTSSILQATLSAPPVNSSIGNSTVALGSNGLQQQLPIHPVPPSAVIRQIITPNVHSGPPPGVLQTQLTIQTNNIAGSSNSVNPNQTTVMLPLTPHPNPHSASSSSLASPQQQIATTPMDGQGSIAVPPSSVLPSPLNVAVDQTHNNTNTVNNNSVIGNMNSNITNNAANNTNSGSENNHGSNSSDQMAISAIMESLMKDTAQFEAEKKQNQLQSPQPPQSPLIANSSVAINSNSMQPQTLGPNGAPLIGGAQLPTCPVPQASLAEAGVVTSPAKQMSAVGGNPNQTTNTTSNRVSLQNLLNAQIQQQSLGLRQISQHPSTSISPNVKVTISQLAAQLQRPSPSVVASVASVSLPSYSQALAQTQQISPGQRLVLAQQTSNLKLQRSNPQTSTSNINTTSLSSIGGSTIALAEKNLSQDAPGLQALLANTPSADNPCLQVSLGSNELIGTIGSGSATIANVNSNVQASSSTGNIGIPIGSGSLLEQLVKGQAITTIAGSIPQGVTNLVNSSVLSPIARSLPNPIASPSSTTANILHNHQQSITTSGLPADSTNDITLATLLAKPIAPGASALPHPSQNNISPAKMSPLLQQLQQPIPPPRPISSASLPSPRQPAPGITSPRRPATTPSPSRTNQSQQPIRSPRPSPTNFTLQQQSPRQHGNMSVLQQQLMQQPNKQNSSILSAQLQQPLNLPASQVPIPVQEISSGSHNNLNNSISNDLANHPQGTVALNGIIGNGSQQQHSQVVSLQNLLQSGVVQVSNVASSGTFVQPITSATNTQSGAATASIPVQLSIPGFSAPVTLSVNLPASSIPTVPSGTTSNEAAGVNNSMNSVIVGGNSVLVASQGQLLGQQQSIAGHQKTVTVSTVGGKYITNNPNALGLATSSSGGVFLQGSTGNIIHLPQQPQQISASSLGSTASGSMTPAAVANIIKPIVSIDSHSGGVANIGALQSSQILKSISVSAVPTSGTIGNQVLQMRQGGQQVFVQVPSSSVSTPGVSPQSIQIVRSLPQGTSNNMPQQAIVHAVQQQPLRPPSLPPPSPQQQLVTLNSALKSPVGLQTLSPQTIPPQSPINNASLNVVMSPPTPQQQLIGGLQDANSILLTSPGGASGLNHSNATATHNNAASAHMKIRAQRKQSLHNT